jgi:serine protease Do
MTASHVPLTPAEIAARATPSICTVRSPHGLGTGFVVDASGIIATNLHVIAGETELIAVFADKRKMPVLEVVAYSERHDLALLRVKPTKPLVALPLGDSDLLRPGDPVVAIGDPLGLEDTVSNGLISAIRTIDAKLTVLQISAPIAPGSSGGPIFDDHGEVVGVATAFSREGQNLGFGMPSHYVKDLIAEPHPIALSDLVDKLRKRTPPPRKRDVPHLPIATLDGCTDDVLDGVVQAISQAIDIGAPLYNGGKIAACYHIYEGTAQDLERRIPASCKGPAKALADGRTKAAASQDPDTQAWAMRDAFDALIDVIIRKRKGVSD